VLGGLGMGGVDVVHERGREEGGKLHGGKDGPKEQPGGQRGGGLRGAMVRPGSVCRRGKWHWKKDNSGGGNSSHAAEIAACVSPAGSGDEVELEKVGMYAD